MKQKSPLLGIAVAAGVVVSLVTAPRVLPWDQPPPGGQADEARPRPDDAPLKRQPVRLDTLTTEYIIRASVFILGDIGTVGSLTLERDVDRQDNDLIKTFRVSGRTKPELVRKGRDIGGEFTTVTRLPVDGAGDPSEAVAGDDPGPKTFYTGVLQKNGVAKGEKVVFFPDSAVSTKTDGSEKKISGRFQSLLSGFEFFLDNPIRPGEVYESKFILDGYPYIFRCEAGQPDYLAEFGVRAFRVDVTTYDGVLRDNRGKPVVVKKKGGIRLWLCKDEPYKDVILKMKLQYKWYLGLNFDLKPVS
jgi:hypothetical protein